MRRLARVAARRGESRAAAARELRRLQLDACILGLPMPEKRAALNRAGCPGMLRFWWLRVFSVSSCPRSAQVAADVLCFSDSCRPSLAQVARGADVLRQSLRDNLAGCHVELVFSGSRCQRIAHVLAGERCFSDSRRPKLNQVARGTVFSGSRCPRVALGVAL